MSVRRGHDNGDLVGYRSPEPMDIKWVPSWKVLAPLASLGVHSGSS
jgi:hypothetical protein